MERRTFLRFDLIPLWNQEIVIAPIPDFPLGVNLYENKQHKPISNTIYLMVEIRELTKAKPSSIWFFSSWTNRKTIMKRFIC